ncbi:hypothetical protein [Geothrix sp.]|uniref:hypothetical protein n=1 Tax=Geothrix sp. TaxID=1962974 RepID=UPI002603124C|nr:hypothetical protein [Geothrix sp.]WIL19444.1 MAG: hypothetical protein QOZ81_001961 [Geothrix sp.]
MRILITLFLLSAWFHVDLHGSQPSAEHITPWLINPSGTAKLISTIHGRKKTFIIGVENPEMGLHLKESFENSSYLCLSFIADSESDVIFVLDKNRNAQVNLGRRFQSYSLLGLINPNFLLITYYDMGSDTRDQYGFVVLRLSDLKYSRIGTDSTNYQLRVDGDRILGTRTVVIDGLEKDVPYSISITQALSRFK